MSTNWENVYLNASQEEDPTKLLNLVHETEAAMLARMQELDSEKADSQQVQAELRQIQIAANGLLSIKTNKLKWPASWAQHPSSAND